MTVLTVRQMESQLNAWGYTLTTKTVPDKEHYGQTLWTVEAVHRNASHKFISIPYTTNYRTYEDAYFRALNSVYDQIKAFEKRHG